MANLKFACVVTLLLVASSVLNVEGLQSNHYFGKCPNRFVNIEQEIKVLVAQAIRKNIAVAPQFIRMIFHDCFVEGCDASILLNSIPAGTAEKDSAPDSFFFIYPLVDQIKTEVEKLCPGVVSCADILAFAASESVTAVGGPFIDVKGGRYDGLVSSSSAALANIPSPFSNLTQLESSFAGKGLSVEDLVILSGAHTVGVGHCGAFTNRLAPTVDPTLDATYAKQLTAKCPPASFSPNTTVPMDTFTPTRWDTGYFLDVATKKGLFTSDAALYTKGSQTKALVDVLKRRETLFSVLFEESLKKLTAIGVKSHSNGNIRAVCTSTKPAASHPPPPPPHHHKKHGGHHKGYGGHW